MLSLVTLSPQLSYFHFLDCTGYSLFICNLLISDLTNIGRYAKVFQWEAPFISSTWGWNRTLTWCRWNLTTLKLNPSGRTPRLLARSLSRLFLSILSLLIYLQNFIWTSVNIHFSKSPVQPLGHWPELFTAGLYKRLGVFSDPMWSINLSVSTTRITAC